MKFFPRLLGAFQPVRERPFSPPRKWLLYPAYPRHFFSLRGLVHICIPHTGTPCGRVMGLKVLPTLVGLSLWDCLALAFCTLIVSQLGRFVKRFLKFLSKDFFYSVRPSPLASCGLLLTSLTLYHTSGGLSRGFLSFFKKLFEVPDCGWRLTLSPRTTMGLPHISWVRSYLPLTLLIIADNSQKSTWQIAQNRDFYFPKLCATFRLTNCWRCVIMEILRASPVGAPPKKPPQNGVVSALAGQSSAHGLNHFQNHVLG